jgi:hypothetical protein
MSSPIPFLRFQQRMAVYLIFLFNYRAFQTNVESYRTKNQFLDLHHYHWPLRDIRLFRHWWNSENGAVIGVLLTVPEALMSFPGPLQGVVLV